MCGSYIERVEFSFDFGASHAHSLHIYDAKRFTIL